MTDLGGPFLQKHLSPGAAPAHSTLDHVLLCVRSLAWHPRLVTLSIVGLTVSDLKNAI